MINLNEYQNKGTFGFLKVHNQITAEIPFHKVVKNWHAGRE
jgi:hypothetical protein